MIADFLDSKSGYAEPLTAEELDRLIEANGEVEVWIEEKNNRPYPGWTKLKCKDNWPLDSYAFVNEDGRFYVRELCGVLWRPWLNEPTDGHMKSIMWNTARRIDEPVPCPFCDCGEPMEIMAEYEKKYDMYDGSAKCGNCGRTIHLEGYLRFASDVYQEIYRVCSDRRKQWRKRG